MRKHLKKIKNLRKHFHETVSLVLVLMLTLGSIFNQSPQASAATYYFSQSSWAGGASTETANHNSNRSGLGNDWTKFATTTFQAPSSLVGLWHMNNDGWTDSSGNNNNGTATGATFSTSAKLGSHSGSFDGVDDYVSVSHVSALNPASFTLEGWVKTTSATNNNGIINKYSAGSSNGYQMYLASGRLKAWVFRDGGNYVDMSATGDDGGIVNDGNWHHVVFVVDNTNGKLYVDGVLKNTKA